MQPNMKTTTIYTEEQIQFIKDNYSIRGGKFCAEKLGFTSKQINKKASMLKLTVDKHVRNTNNSITRKNISDKEVLNRKILADAFKITNKHLAYLLGFIWGDGYLGRTNTIRYYMDLTIDYNDGQYLKEIVDICDFPYWEYILNRPNRKQALTIKMKDAIFNEFLYLMDYTQKSKVSPDKILNRIPKDLHYAFFLGFFDADGCFYVNKQNCAYQCSFTGTYNYDWGFVEKLLNELKIEKYEIRNIQELNSKCSRLRLSNRKNIVKFIDYLYQDSELKGLNRKFNKSRLFKRDSESLCHDGPGI